MAPSLLERYEEGEERAVWEELRRLDPVPDADLYPIAWPVVEATMLRVAFNIGTIVDRLHQLRYRWGHQAQVNDRGRLQDRMRAESPASAAEFAAWEAHAEAFAEQSPDMAAAREEARARAALRDVDEYRYEWAPPGPGVDADIERVERAVGRLPLALRGLFRFVGPVDLAGSLPTWDPSAFIFEGPEPWPSFGVFSCPLSLYGARVTLGYVDHSTGQLSERYRNSDGTYSMYLGPDATASAGYSGGCHDTVLPGAPVDPFVRGIGRRRIGSDESIPLVEYLRWVFDWGGFPGFQTSAYVPPEIDILKSGLLPI